MQTMYSCGCMYHMGKPPASIGGEQEISNRGRGQSPSDKRSARMRRDSKMNDVGECRPESRAKTRLRVLNLAKAVSEDETAFDATDESGFDYN